LYTYLYCAFSGYVIYHTADASAPMREWSYRGLRGDRLNARVKELTPNTLYHFRAQVRNGWGFGPISQTVAHRTPTGKDNLNEMSVGYMG
jgi:hypothetical protein